MPNTKPPYPDAFRTEAISLVRSSGKPIAAVGRDLGVSGETVRRWVRPAAVDAGRGRPGELTTTEREDLARLRRENHVLQMEREILRTATACFHGPPGQVATETR